jgi:hypothetical protein
MKAIRALCITLLLLTLGPAPTTTAQTSTISCRSRPTLSRTTSINGATTCFTVTPARGSTALRFDLGVTSGAYDLYVKAGSVTSLTAGDKVNVSAASSGLSYVLVNPGTGAYTVAVVRTGRSGGARLSPMTGYAATLKCSGATCTAIYPLTSMPGNRYGDLVILPAAISKAGRVQVEVSWKGTARLSAMLYGPSISRTSVTQSSLARKDGASPLNVTYSVRSTNLIRGGKWSVGLSNASKGTGTVSSGEVRITYPR